MEQPRQKRWWYRLVQVVYILLAGLTVVSWLAVLFVTVQSSLTVSESASQYQVTCHDGRTSEILLPPSWELNSAYTDFDRDRDREAARFFCSRPDLSRDEARETYEKIVPPRTGGYVAVNTRALRESGQAIEYIIIKEKNYNIELVKKVYQGSWSEVFFVFMAGLILIPLVFALIRAVFLYVAFGESFKKSLLFWNREKSMIRSNEYDDSKSINRSTAKDQMQSKFTTLVVSALILIQIYVRDLHPPSFIEFVGQIGGVIIGSIVIYIPLTLFLERKMPRVAQNKILVVNIVLSLYLLLTLLISMS